MGGRGASKGGKGGGGGTNLPPVGGTEEDRAKISDEVWESVDKSLKRVDAIFAGEIGTEGDEAVKSIIPMQMRDGTFAACTHNGDIKLNTQYYGDPDFFNERYTKSVETGFHPQGTTWEHVADHEAGHAWERIVNDAYMRKNNITNGPKYWDYFFDRKGIYDIVRDAKAAAKKSIKKSTGQTVAVTDIVRGLSRYATKNYHETFAEAVADYSANGKNANPLSIEIIRIAREVLK